MSWDIDLVRQIEPLALHAWPAAETHLLDGWCLRFTQRVTRRANSVWPNGSETCESLAPKLVSVEEWYAQRLLPARYQICPANQPPDLDTILAQRGYSKDGETSIQIADVSTVLAQTAPHTSASIRITDRFEDCWFDAYCRAEVTSGQEAEIRRAILRRIAPCTAYVLLSLDGRPAAQGLGVMEDGWVGVFSMATHPEFRRQGLATAVLHALTGWGQSHAASRLYLQVMHKNLSAHALYERARFTPLYDYHYREAPTIC